MQKLTSLLEIDSQIIDHKYLKPATLAPLPFQGQKRQFLKVVKDRLQKLHLDPHKPLVFVDAFGGSGLLSNCIKNLFPQAQVIWNDFDNYYERLSHIQETQELLDLLYTKYAGTTPKQHTFNEATRDEIKSDIYHHHCKYGYVDFKTIGCNLLFAGNYFSSLEDVLDSEKNFFNRLTKKPKSTDGYLHGIERVSLDGFILLEKIVANLNEFEGQVILILDPPYVSTHSDGYECDFWKLRDFKPLLDLIKHANLPYLLFGSGKSNIKELYDLRKECYEAAAQHELKLVTQYFSHEPNFNDYLNEHHEYKFEELHFSYGQLHPNNCVRDTLEYAIDNFNERFNINLNN